MSDSFEVTCPSCDFSRPVPLDRLPPKEVKATCPKCGASFAFDRRVNAPPQHSEIADLTAPALNNIEPVSGITGDASEAALSSGLPRELVTELHLLNSAQGKSNSIGLLIITVILFFSAQIVSMKWQELLILMGVLFFHEIGHLTAMKLLKYTDLKMFFIPFFGAAVSGKSSNQTALKSCIVSLMGPLPGIILSVVLFIVFLFTKNYYLYKTAQVMMLLNVFNLLPIMPLDGGRFVDVLFVNRRYLRFVFTFLGAAAFLIMAVSFHDFLLGFLGVMTVYIALCNLTLHRISGELTSEGMEAASVDDVINNEDALQHFIGKIRSHFPKLFSPQLNCKGIFNKLTVVVDTMRYKPARFLTKVLLLCSYAVCILVSIVALIIIVGASYREQSRTAEAGGKRYTYVERYFYGKKRSECSINSKLYYDGKGTSFEADGSVDGVFYYKDGYRTGEWLSFDKSGAVTEKRIYERGRLLSASTNEHGEWKTASVADMSVLKRCFEEIQRLSQPYKSNHEYF